MSLDKQLDEILYQFQHQRKLGTFRVSHAKQAILNLIEEEKEVSYLNGVRHTRMMIERTLKEEQLPRGEDEVSD